MWLATVPTLAQPESSAALSTARRSSATSLLSPRSWARVARGGGPTGAAALAEAFFAVVFAPGVGGPPWDAAALAAAPVFAAPVFAALAIGPVFAVLVVAAVARLEDFAGAVPKAASSSAAGSTASACPLGADRRSSTRKRVHALWKAAGVLASPNP